MSIGETGMAQVLADEARVFLDVADRLEKGPAGPRPTEEEGSTPMKVLSITMPDGSIWHVPARPLAEERARYYACERYGHAEGSAEFANEVEYSLATDVDLIDYVRNNMGWTADLVRFGAQQVKPPKPVDYAQAWNEAEHELLDVDEAAHG